MLLDLVHGEAHISFGDDGRVVIEPPNKGPKPPCVHGGREEYNNEQDERSVDREGTGTSGEGNGPKERDQRGTETDEDHSGGSDDDGGGITP